MFEIGFVLAWRLFKLMFIVALVHIVIKSCPGGAILGHLVFLLERAIESANWSAMESMYKELIGAGALFLIDFLSGRDSHTRALMGKVLDKIFPGAGDVVDAVERNPENDHDVM